MSENYRPFIPPSAGLEAQSTQRENIFSFLVIPLKKAGLSGQQKRKDLRHKVFAEQAS